MIDPASGLDRTCDVLIVDGRVSAIGTAPGTHADLRLDATDCIVSPGFIDCHVAFREPGSEEDETISTGSRSAIAGGFTTVACLPDTEPPIDTRAAAEFVIRQSKRADGCRVFPLGAVTKGLKGEELAEIGQLIHGGAVGFSEGKQAIANAEIMRRALQYTSMWTRPLLHQPQVRELSAGGVMHEGYVSTLLGLRGIPAAAEEIMVRRDIALVESTGGRIHLMCLSSLRSVDEVRQAQARGLNVTADVTPHHLLMTDDMLSEFDTHLKVDPPLRTGEHRQALIAGLKDGTIGIIASDHQPWAQEKKEREFDQAPAGIIGLETLLPICIEALIDSGALTWPELISKLTIGPAQLLGLDAGTLTVGAPADVVVFDPTERWTVNAQQFASRSRNTPYHGKTVTGRVRHTLVDGEVRFPRPERDS